MPVFAFIVFQDEGEKVRLGSLVKSGFFKTWTGTAVFRFLNKREFGKQYCTKCKIPDTEIASVKLPIPVSYLHLFNIKYLEGFIDKLSGKNGWVRCFISDKARKEGGFQQFKTDTGSRKQIFRALLIPILETIYTRNGVGLDKPDIAVLYGASVETCELLYVIKHLEPYVKYINIASADKMKVETQISDICADSGLSVFVSSDFRGILRNADLIINLAEGNEFSKYKIKSGSLMINLSNSDNKTMQGEYSVINGLKYSFQDNQYSEFGNEILRSFSKSELSELLMGFKAGLVKEAGNDYGINNDEYFDEIKETILEVFKSCKCTISGFIGRRGFLKIKSVLQSVKTVAKGI